MKHERRQCFRVLHSSGFDLLQRHSFPLNFSAASLGNRADREQRPTGQGNHNDPNFPLFRHLDHLLSREEPDGIIASLRAGVYVIKGIIPPGSPIE